MRRIYPQSIRGDVMSKMRIYWRIGTDVDASVWEKPPYRIGVYGWDVRRFDTETGLACNYHSGCANTVDAAIAYAIAAAAEWQG